MLNSVNVIGHCSIVLAIDESSFMLVNADIVIGQYLYWVDKGIDGSRHPGQNWGYDVVGGLVHVVVHHIDQHQRQETHQEQHKDGQIPGW